MDNHLGVGLRDDVGIDTREGNVDEAIALSEQVGANNGHNSVVLTLHWEHRGDIARNGVFKLLGERAIRKRDGFNHLIVVHCDDDGALLVLPDFNSTCNDNDFRVALRDNLVDFNAIKRNGCDIVASGKQCDTTDGDYGASLSDFWLECSNGAVCECVDCGDLHTSITSHDNITSFRSFGSWPYVGSNNQSVGIGLVARHLCNNTSQSHGHNFRSSAKKVVTVDGDDSGALPSIWTDACNVTGAEVFKSIFLGDSCTGIGDDHNVANNFSAEVVCFHLNQVAVRIDDIGVEACQRDVGNFITSTAKTFTSDGNFSVCLTRAWIDKLNLTWK